jgi:hippurate hydrolase
MESLERISYGIAQSAGLPESHYPVINPLDNITPPVINDEKLTLDAVRSLSGILGQENVIKVEPMTAGEDFARYGRTDEKIPIAMFWLGTVKPEKFEIHKNDGIPLPPLHSPEFFPEFETTYSTGVLGMSKVIMDLFNN